MKHCLRNIVLHGKISNSAPDEKTLGTIVSLALTTNLKRS